MADNVEIGLVFKSTYEGLEEGKQDLKELKKIIDSVKSDDIDVKLDGKDIEQAKLKIDALEKSIKEAESSGGDFGTIFKQNLNDIQKEAAKTAAAIEKTEKSVKGLNNASGGNKGLYQISNAARLATKEVKGTAGQIDQLRNNLQQGLGQSIAFGAIGLVTGSVVQALSTASQLDKVSTDISIVSAKTRKEMEGYRDAAVEASDALGTTTKDYLKASLIYEQQGGQAAYYAKELAESTVVAANVSGMATDEMSEYLTSTINGFQLLKEKGGEAGTYITDVLAKLGAASGSDLGEVATGLSRTANTAKDAGFAFEEISTMIATVSEVTRQAPESIGTAFKTILTNITSLKDAGEEEVKAFTNDVAKALKSGGIDDIPLFDNGNLRDAADIIKDISGRWDEMDKVQQSLVSEALAGKRQAEVLRAYLNNQERYNDLLDEAYGSAGTAAQQQLIYMDSLDAKVNQLKNGWQGVVNHIVDSDFMKDVLDDATNFLKIISSTETAAGGLATAMSPLIGIGGQLFGAKKVSEGFSNFAQNKIARDTVKDYEALLKVKGSVNDETLLELKNAQRLQQVQNQLGPEAASNWEAQLAEVQRLNDSLSLIPDKQEDIIAKSRELARELVSSGGVKGLDNNREINSKSKEMAPDSKAYKSYEKALEEIAKEKEDLQQRFFKAVEELENYSSLYKTNPIQRKDKNDRKANLKDMKSWANDYKKVVNQTIESTDATKPLKESFNKIAKEIENFKGSTEGLIALRTRAGKVEGDIRDALMAQNGTSEKAIDLAKEQYEILSSAEARNAALKRGKEEVATELIGEELKAKYNTSQDLINQKNLLEKNMEATEKAAIRTRRVEKAVSGLSLAYSTIIPIVSTFNAVQKEEISVQDGVMSGIQSTSAMLLASMNPYGIAAGAIIGALGLIVDKFELFRTKAEKAKEGNDELIKSFMSLQEQTSSKLSNLTEVQDIYERFAGVDAEAFLSNAPTPGPDNQEEVEQYKKDLEEYDTLAGKIAASNPELVKGYDDTGRAIIDLSQDFDGLLEKQKQAQADNYGLMLSNKSSFFLEQTSEIENARNKMSEYGIEISSLDKQLSDARASGDDEKVEELLPKILESKNALAKIQEDYKNAKDSIQSNIVIPFNEANREFNKLADSAPELKTAFDSFSSGFVNTETLSAMANLGEDGQMTNLLDNMGKIRDEYVALGQENPEAATNFLNEITSSSEWAKTALYETSDSVDDLMQKIDEFSGGAMASADDNSSTFIDKIVPEDKIEEAQNRVASLEKDVDRVQEKSFWEGGGVISDGVSKAIKTIGTDEINKSIKPFNELKSAMAEVSEQYEKTSRTAEGFNENLSNLDGLDKAKEQLSSFSKDGINTDSFEEFAKQFPKLAEKIKESSSAGNEEFQRTIKDSYDMLEEESNAAITGMSMNNSEFYREWLANNSTLVQGIAENYDIDGANYNSLSEYKQALNQLDLDDLRIIAGQMMDTHQELNDDIIKGEQDRAITSVRFNQIWEDNSLTTVQKIGVTFMNLFDAIANGLGFLQEKIGNFFSNILNQIQSFAGDKLSDGLKAIGIDNGLTDWLDNLGSGGPAKIKFKDSTFAKDYLKKKADEKEEADSIIQQILDGSLMDSNGKSNKEIFEELGLNNPQKAPSIGGKTTPTSGENGDYTDANGDESTKSEVADLELEFDRYYKLEDILKTIEKRYSELSDAKDAAYGNDKLAIMDQERNLLAEKTGVLKEYIAALQQEQAETKKQLADNGFAFTANGDISNLNEKLKAMQDHANSLSGEAKEQAIDAVNKIKEVAERYQDITFNLIPDKQQALNEIKKTLSALEKEKIEYKIKLVTDAKELKDTVLETVKEFQDSFSDLDEKAQIVSKQMQSSLDSVAYWEQMIAEARKNSNLTDNDRQEMMKEYNKNLLSAVSEARSSYEELLDIQNEYVTQSVEAIDKLTERYQDIIDKAGTLAEKTYDIYGTKASDKIAEYYGVQEDAINSQIANLQQAQKELIAYRDTLEEGTEAWEAANDAVNEMGNSISDAILSRLDILQQKFDLFTESLKDSFNDMFGIYGLEGAVEDFQDLLDKQDKYFSNMDKFATIGSKIKSINDEIAKTNDPERAKELAKYRDEELANLLEQEKVTQDDYDRAEKLYEIKLKELALEERQNAKRMAQLVRDSNGNMTYEYVRTESEDTSKDREELEKDKNDLYEFDSEKAKEAAKGVFDIISEYQDKISELKDKGLDPEGYEEELKKLLDEAQKDIQEKTGEMNKWIENAAKDGMSSLKTMIGNGTITADQLGIDEDTLSSIFSGLNDGALSIQDIMSGDYDEFANSLGMTTEELSSAMGGILEIILGDNLEMAQAMQDASDKWTSTAKDNVETLGDAYADYMSEADKILNDYTSSTGNLNEKLNETDVAAKKVINTINEQTQAMIKTQEQTDRTANSVQNLQNKLIGVNGISGLYGSMVQLQKNMNENLQPAYANTGNQTDILTGKTYNSATKFDLLSNKAYSAYQRINSYSDQPTKTAMGNIDTIGSKTRVTANAFKQTNIDAKQAKNSVRDFSNEIGQLQGYGSYKLSRAASGTKSFDTGGYTGKWTGSTNNAEGRLAVLHEKELVLNSKDTENILSAVKIQRNLLDSIKGRGNSVKNTVQNLSNNISNVQNNNSSQQTVEQSITLNPSFPNAVNRSEIEGALSGLLVKASTYVGKV